MNRYLKDQFGSKTINGLENMKIEKIAHVQRKNSQWIRAFPSGRYVSGRSKILNPIVKTDLLNGLSCFLCSSEPTSKSKIIFVSFPVLLKYLFTSNLEERKIIDVILWFEFVHFSGMFRKIVQHTVICIGYNMN